MSTNHMGVKTFIVSWITFMDTIPEIRIFNVLPDFLPGLFVMLSNKQKEVYIAAEKCLKEFLRELTNQFEGLTFDIEYKILEIIIEQSKADHDSTKLTAFEWIKTFLLKYKEFFKEREKTNLIKDNAYREATNFHSKTNDFFIGNNNYDNYSKNNSENIFFDSTILCNNENDQQEHNLKIPFNLFPKILEVILLSVNNKNEKISTIVKYFNIG